MGIELFVQYTKDEKLEALLAEESHRRESTRVFQGVLGL